jgi:hypothetical protein
VLLVIHIGGAQIREEKRRAFVEGLNAQVTQIVFCRVFDVLKPKPGHFKTRCRLGRGRGWKGAEGPKPQASKCIALHSKTRS